MDIVKQYENLEVKKYMLKAKEKLVIYSSVVCSGVGTGMIVLNGISILPFALFGGTIYGIYTAKKTSSALEQVRNEQAYLANKLKEEKEEIKREVANYSYPKEEMPTKQKEKRLVKEKRL